jgi:hypothetical protein
MAASVNIATRNSLVTSNIAPPRSVFRDLTGSNYFGGFAQKLNGHQRECCRLISMLAARTARQLRRRSQKLHHHLQGSRY